MTDDKRDTPSPRFVARRRAESGLVDPFGRWQKAYTCAALLGEPGATELRGCIDDLAAAHREIEALRRERDESVQLLEALPLWADYEWRDAAESVRLKLKENAKQIVSLIEERDLAVEALEDVLLVLGTPREVNIGTPCWRYECTFAQHKTNPIEQARTALAKLKGGENG